MQLPASSKVTSEAGAACLVFHPVWSQALRNGDWIEGMVPLLMDDLNSVIFSFLHFF